PDTDCWKSAVEKELLNLNSNHMYKTVPILEGVTLSHPPVFHIECDHTGNVKCYKVCIVTWGFTRKEGINYRKYLPLWQTWTPSRSLLLSLQNMTWSSTKWMSPLVI
ncbi:hypothetical protein PAXRUDRAFT_129612, partial [Paxillus rubicundulus Ve08.2h10]